MSYIKDVFVSYCKNDLEWVNGELLKRLRDGRVSYIEQRDFRPGNTTLNELENAITTSRRTILIISNAYLDDDWKEMENGMAFSFSLEKRTWSVVPVLIGENLDLPLRIRALVAKNLCAPTDDDWNDFVRLLSSEPTVDVTEAPTKPKPEPKAEQNGHAAGNGLALLVELMARNEVSTALREYRADFEDLCVGMNILNRFKGLHDKFQSVETSFNMFVNFARPDSNGLMAWEHLLIPGVNLSDGFKELAADGCAIAFAKDNDIWVKRLGRACTGLQEAIQQNDSTKLKSAIVTASQVFDTIPSRLNMRMVAEAKALRLTSLGRALLLVHSVLKRHQPAPAIDSHLTRIENSATRIDEMDRGLRSILYVHDCLQQIDNELRRVEATLEDDVSQVIGLWDDLKPTMEILSNDNSSDWATALTAAGTKFEVSLPGEPNNLKTEFRLYRNQVSRSFNRVDSDMLNRCKELNDEISKPLAPLLTLLQAQCS